MKMVSYMLHYKNNAVYMQDQDGLSDIPMILTETDTATQRIVIWHMRC